MSPLTRSPILSALARTNFQRTTARQFRHYATARATAAPANFASPSKRVLGTFMMYMPVVALTMFWPYAVSPVMDFMEGV